MADTVLGSGEVALNKREKTFHMWLLVSKVERVR